MVVRRWADGGGERINRRKLKVSYASKYGSRVARFEGLDSTRRREEEGIGEKVSAEAKSWIDAIHRGMCLCILVRVCAMGFCDIHISLQSANIFQYFRIHRLFDKL